MEIKYFVKQNSNKNLYCQISEKRAKITFSMEYNVDPERWDAKEGDRNDPHYFALQNFIKYLFLRYFELANKRKENILSILREEGIDLLVNSGVEGVSRNIFNRKCKKFGVPEYDEYLLAFEKYTGLKKENYQVEILGYLLRFHTEKEIYEMNTYEGLTALLKEVIENRSYFRIAESTDKNIWQEIYYDDISKHQFLSAMQLELERHFKEDFQGIGTEKSMMEKKNRLWEKFQLFHDHYDEGNIVELAWEIDKNILYPIVVIVITTIYRLDVCFMEYCETEFYVVGKGWEWILLHEELDEDGLSFYIRPCK
jgi:hypothetical protein